MINRLILNTITTLLLLQFNLLTGADNYQVGDKLYVWAQSGLNIRSTPETSGKKLGTLTPGDRVKVVAVTQQKLNLKAVAARPELYPDNIYGDKGEENSFYLTATWIKIETVNLTGYIIDTYLLSFPPPPEKMDFKAYIEFLEGEPLVIDTMFSDPKEEYKEYYTFQAKSKSGIEYHREHFNAAQGFSLTFPNLTIEEGFVFFNFFNPLEDSNRQKNDRHLLTYMGNLSDSEGIWFMDGEICEIGFSIWEENKLRISSGCSC